MLIEERVRSLLRKMLQKLGEVDRDVLVGLPDEIPSGGSMPYVLDKISDSSKNRLYHATLALQSYGKSLHEAALASEKARKAIALFEKFPQAAPEISTIKVTNEYNFPDTELKWYRYQILLEVSYYSEEAL